jgi:glycosyltransferase involved in cell wall biosynthesis
MIVKDESHVIARCLASVRPLIDAWAIVDTGSADGTQQLVREALRDLPGELVERPWVDFGHNRTEALQHARGRADYVLLIDADETLEAGDGFTWDAGADAFAAGVLRAGLTSPQPRLIRGALPWRYEGVLHARLTCDVPARTAEAAIRMTVHGDGARSRDPHKARRDALVLERALLDEPDDARYAFYLAQSYRDAGEVDQALRWYRKRAAMGGAPDDVWFSLYQAAETEQRAQKPWPDVLQSYLRAYEQDPSRAEPLFRVALAYQARHEYHAAMLYLSRAAALPVPPASASFVDRALYEVQLPVEHAVAAYYVGDHETAIATNNRLLRTKSLPPALIEHVISNRRFSLDVRAPRLPPDGKPVRVHAVVVYRDPGPELDDLVESLLRQSAGDWRATFVDDGSRTDHAARLPLDDVRCTLVRHAEPVGAERAVRLHLPSDDVVVAALTPAHRLADAQAFATVAEAFADPGCALLYGQFRRADGSLGDAEPAESAAAFAACGVASASGTPLFFRAALARGAGADNGNGADDGAPFFSAVWTAAGLERTRFSDRALAVAAPPAPVASAQARVASGGNEPLPLISCLMVTYDRLVLAKRALRSFAEQTWPSRELVVVTDGPLRFREALEEHVAAAGIAGVRFVYPEPPGLGLGALRNIAVDAARGELVCQWDDDDYSHPERLAVQAADLLARGADASFLSEHLQFIEDRRTAFWLDWTGGGARSGVASWFPGTLMMRRGVRPRYPEAGRYARTGEDTVLMHELAASVPVVGLGGNPHLYVYQYHGRNVFSEEHHAQLRVWAVGAHRLASDERRIRETLLCAAVPRPAVVAGNDATAFVVA